MAYIAGKERRWRLKTAGKLGNVLIISENTVPPLREIPESPNTSLLEFPVRIRIGI